MRITNAKVQRWANYATIIAASTAIITLVWGFLIFRQTSNQQADAAAVKMTQDYIQFNFAHSDVLKRGLAGQIDEDYLWFASHNMLVAETIYKLNEGDEGWEATVIHMANNHKPFLLHEAFPCKEYDPKFVRFLQDRVDKNVCPDIK
jgi:hypothetical protein